MKKIILLLILINGSILKSQLTNFCGTDEYYKVKKDNGLDFTDSVISSNSQFQNFRSTSQVLSDQIVYIPVVFHVVFNGSINAPGNISDAQITDALITLNNSFANINNHPNGVNCKFQFCLAKVDGNNNPINGITRHYTPKSYFMPMQYNSATSNFPDEADLKSYGMLSPSKYLNIWVADIRYSYIENNQTVIGDLSGYSSFPWETSTNYFNDGIIINYKRLGSTGTAANQSPISLGKTLPHEVGHWLGLYHTFQDFGGPCANANCNTQGDLICDTPPFGVTATNLSGTAYGDPQVVSNSCAYRDDCNSNFVSAENYMDYNFDNCRNFFSQGQKDRMRYMCSYYRNYFWINSINNPQVFPIECTTPNPYLDPTGGVSSSCTNNKWPDEMLYVNGSSNNYIELCSGTPVIINQEHGSNCTRIPEHWVNAPCSADPNCDWLSQLMGLCECGITKTTFFLSISYNCDGNFNCNNETGAWYTYVNYSFMPHQMDIGSMFNFSFQANTNYKVKLAVTDYSNNWRQGEKKIRFIENDSYQTGNVSSEIKASNAIQFTNATFPNNSNYTASNLIQILPNSKAANGNTSRFYISPVTCSNLYYRNSNPDSNSVDTPQIDKYIVIQTPRNNTYNNDNISTSANKDNILKKSIKIIPNPSSDGFFRIEKNGVNVKSILIYNNIQKIVSSFENTNEINLSNESEGIYYARIVTDLETYYEKIIYAK